MAVGCGVWKPAAFRSREGAWGHGHQRSGCQAPWLHPQKIV